MVIASAVPMLHYLEAHVVRFGAVPGIERAHDCTEAAYTAQAETNRLLKTYDAIHNLEVELRRFGGSWRGAHEET